MENRNILEAVDRTMKDIRKDNRTFGGVTVVLADDWRQILPIVKKGRCQSHETYEKYES